MQPIKTIWEWSLESEAKQIIHCAHQIVTGFFRYNNFFLTPWKPGDDQNPMTVPFPSLPYQTIPRFWKRVKRVDIRNFPLDFDPDLVDSVAKLLKEFEELPLSPFKQVWHQAGNEIMAEIYKIMPSKKECVSQIIIHLTRFGTTVSFSIAKSFSTTVEMYLRQDRDIYSIAEAILSAITHHEVYENLDGLWSESELLVDWLITKSSLSPILKKYQPITTFMPTVKYTRMKQSARLMKESEEFYRKLRVPILGNFFDLKEGKPMIAGQIVENIPAREQKILKLMIEKSNSIVTIDDLASLLFKTDEDFSLQAIAKTIQRLRDNLERNGVSGSFIQTLRGQGYVLKN